MKLTGYAHPRGKRSGGIRSVALVRADAVVGVTVDPASGCCSEISLADGESFAVYGLKEDEAAYVETAKADGASLLVEHTLTIVLERMDRESARAVSELCSAAPHGLLALVTANSGETLLVGYSERFEGEYPLRVGSAVASTGRKFADTNAEILVLTSVDTAKALVFTGAAPE